MLNIDESGGSQYYILANKPEYKLEKTEINSNGELSYYGDDMVRLENEYYGQ